jgi:hypothetical protein
MAAGGDRVGFRAAAGLFARHKPVTFSMIALAMIIPGYLFIGGLVRGRTLFTPALWLDRALPVEPAWSIVYLSLFLAALLPTFVVHQQELLRRTVLSYRSGRGRAGLACGRIDALHHAALRARCHLRSLAGILRLSSLLARLTSLSE